MAKQDFKKRPEKTIHDLELGKIPPHSEDLEATVLGQLMLEDDSFSNVSEILKPDSFYIKKHQTIYESIRSLSFNNEPVNLQTVIEDLRRKEKLDEVGGALYISQLTQMVSSAAHLEHHAKLVAQKYIQREFIRVSAIIQEKAFDTTCDVSDLINYAEKNIFDVTDGNVKKSAASIGQILEDALGLIKTAQENKNKYSGEPSGFTALDTVTSGWQKSNMIVVAARPAMGKTAFILTMLRNMAVDHNLPVALFSLEMDSVQLVNRLIVAETEIGHDKIKRGELSDNDWVTIHNKTMALKNAKIFFDDTPALSIYDFRSKCRRLKEKHDIKCVFIDYLQLMTSSMSASREQEVSSISRQIKAVAMELKIPVIALSQLNRSVETRTGNKRPQLSDLRESGAIEQDADLVMFIHRPEYSGILTDDEGNSTQGKAEIIIAKNRHGETRIITLDFIPELTKFQDQNYFEGKIKDFDTDFNNDAQNVTYQIMSSRMNANTSTTIDNSDDFLQNLSPSKPFTPDDSAF